jgi:hypothetical protein
MENAIKAAKANHCVGIWLDSFEFQAIDFYKKFGFEAFRVLDNHPVGRKRFFLRRTL